MGLVSGVATRPGMKSFYADAFVGNPTVDYLKTFVDSTDVFHLLSLDSQGNVRDETPCPTPPGVPNIIGTVVAGCLCQSDSLFGREWMAFSDQSSSAGFGLDIPRQWDGVNFDRVSQVGPGAPPAVMDEDISLTIEASPTGAREMNGNVVASPNGYVQTGKTVLVTLSAPATYLTDGVGFIGDVLRIIGSVSGDYDGDWIVSRIISTTQFEFIHTISGLAPDGGGIVYFGVAIIRTIGMVPLLSIGQPAVVTGTAGFDGTFYIRKYDFSAGNTNYYIYGGAAFLALADSGGGTLDAAGNIPAGRHLASVSFITRGQYITKPAPFATWIAAGGKRATVSNIPIPLNVPNVVGRILIFTPVITPPAILGEFFYFDGDVPVVPGGLSFPTMVISDVATTSYTVDFLDSTLELATPATQLFRLLELGECASVCSYSNRTFWAGERNKLPNFVNLTFDGGGSNTDGIPFLGWTVDPTNGSAITNVPSSIWGAAYQVQRGIFVTSRTGLISQSAYQDYLGVPIIQGNTAYSIRMRVARSGHVITYTGTLTVELYSASMGSFGTFSLTFAQVLNSTPVEFIGQLGVVPSPPKDLVLRMYADDLSFGGGFLVDCLEIFPTRQPYNQTLVRGSYSGDPESFDQTTGYLLVGQDNGQSVRCMFTLLDNKMYIVKERSLYSTQDDGRNEPSSWVVTTVSGTVGTGSVHGVGIGPSWAVIAHHDGLYIFWGGEPVKISQEIQPDWDRINWNAQQKIYVVVDTARKRIHVGAPIDGSSHCNTEFVCDYSQLANTDGSASGQDIASHPQVSFTSSTSDVAVALGKSRKWTLWNIYMNCGTIAVRGDGSYKLLRGNGTGTGKVYDQSYTQLSDDGVAIDGQYQTCFFPQADQEQSLRLGTHRKLFKYLTGYAVGGGTMNFTVYGSQNQRSVSLSSLTLENTEHWDFEKNVNFISERMSLAFGVHEVGGWFELTKLAPVIQAEIVTPVRGNK